MRLVSLQLEVGNYKGALSVGQPVLKELKRLDDKALLVEVRIAYTFHLISAFPSCNRRLSKNLR